MGKRFCISYMLLMAMAAVLQAEQPSIPELTPEVTRPPAVEEAPLVPQVVSHELVPTWGDADHASGIYPAKAAAKLTVYFDNPAAEAKRFSGTIEFGVMPGKDEAFKAISITPITSVNLEPRQRVKIPLEVTFAAAGVYELRWVHDGAVTAIANADLPLRCIFSPRVPASAETPWITPLPKPATRSPGFIADYVAQTSVRHFLVDERFAFDAETGIGLAAGASLQLPPEQVDALFKQIAAAKAMLVWRVTIPANAAADARTLGALRRYFADLAPRARKVLRGVVIAPDPAATADQRRAFRQFYLAAYEAVKSADHNIMLLGAGDAASTRELLIEQEPSLRKYVDALAITDTGKQAAIAQQLAGEASAGKLPLVVLPAQNTEPWAMVPPAAALAEGAILAPVPPPEIDRGVAAHLLGGTVLFQQLHPEALPYVAVLQGDGYAVAAIAGPRANTQADGAFPGLASSLSIVILPNKDDHPYPHLEVSDDSNSLRVVDAAGMPIDARKGDTLFVPAGDSVVYVISGGTAEDLASVLWPAQAKRLPALEVTTALAEGAMTVHLTNISAREVSGTLSIIEANKQFPDQSTVLGTREFGPIATAKVLELAVPIARVPKAGETVIVEFRCKGFIQRTAILPAP